MQLIFQDVQLFPTFRGKLSVTSSAFSCNKKDPKILPQTTLKTGEDPKKKQALGNDWPIKIGERTLQSEGQANKPCESKSQLSFQQNSPAPQDQGV